MQAKHALPKQLINTKSDDNVTVNEAISGKCIMVFKTTDVKMTI